MDSAAVVRAEYYTFIRVLIIIIALIFGVKYRANAHRGFVA